MNWQHGQHHLLPAEQDLVEVLPQLISIEARVWALVGPMGAGKTTLVQAWAKQLGVVFLTEVTSPTYSLMHHYAYPQGILVHIDFYRLNEPDQVEALGLAAAIDDANHVAVEWADKFPQFLPTPTTWLRLGINAFQQRTLDVVAT